MTVNQIKRRIGKDPTFTLAQFSIDMHLVWDNARTYNEDGSWVYTAADEMQVVFRQDVGRKKYPSWKGIHHHHPEEAVALATEEGVGEVG